MISPSETIFIRQDFVLDSLSFFSANSEKIIELLLQKAIPCPKCMGLDLRPMPYGMGTIGGCVVSKESPKILCNSCHHRFLTDQEVDTIHSKLVENYRDITDQYLMEELLLPVDVKVSRYVRMTAISFIQEEKNLLQLRLLGDPELQSWIKSRVEQIREG